MKYRSIGYSTHALERMAPGTPRTIEELLFRAFEGMEEEALKLSEYFRRWIVDETEYYYWWKKHCPQPRNITRQQVEQELQLPGSTGLKVRFENNEGHISIITVYEKKQSPERRKILNEIEERVRRRAEAIEKRLNLFKNKKYKSKINNNSIKTVLSVRGFRRNRCIENEQFSSTHESPKQDKEETEEAISAQTIAPEHSTIVVQEVTPISEKKDSKVATRKARYVRGHVALSEAANRWEKEVEQTKKLKKKGVNIAEWKAAKKAKQK